MTYRMVEEEVEEGDRLMLWERQEILERERKEKEEEEMARYSETNSNRKRQSESDPSKAVELSSLVERLARVAALPPPVPPSSSCAPPTTPPGFSPFFNGCTYILDIWMSSYGYNNYSSQHVPQLQLALGTLAFLGRGGKVLENLS